MFSYSEAESSSEMHVCVGTMQRGKQPEHEINGLFVVHNNNDREWYHWTKSYNRGTTTGRPQIMTACRCGLNGAGTVRPNLKAANSSPGVSGCPLGCTPSLRGSSAGAAAELEDAGAAAKAEGSLAPLGAESPKPARTLSSLCATPSCHRGSGAAPLGSHVNCCRCLAGIAAGAEGAHHPVGLAVRRVVCINAYQSKHK